MFEFAWEFWYWWVFGLIFLVLEILIFGFFFLWLAIAAAITGLLVLLMPFITQSGQLLMFSLLAIISILAWKFMAKNVRNQKTDHPTLNKRGEQYLGRTFNLYQAIENGQGKIKVDDTIWKVHGDDCDLTTKVKVVAIRGTVFDVVHSE